MGRNVTLDEMPDRIVSCAPSITETVYAVGIGDKLVGVTTYCNYPDEVNSRKENGTLSNIGGYSTPNVEAILNLTPDLVLVDGSVSAHQTLIDSLTVMNVTVVAIYKGSSIGEVYKNIDMVGKISGASDNSTALINEMKSRISNIESKLSSVTTQRSIVDAIWLDPIYVAAGNTYVQDMFNISKGTNPFADQTGFPVVSMEAVIEANPDVLVLPGKMGMDYSDDLISYLRNDSMWSQISAVKTDNVFILEDQAANLLNRAGPRVVDAIELLACMMYPDIMNVTLPKNLGDEYAIYLDTSYEAEDNNIPASVVDGIGRTVKLDSQPSRIVSTSDTTTAMVYALGLGDKIVGVNSDGNYDVPSTVYGLTTTGNFPQDVVDGLADGSIQSVGGTWRQNAETIAGLNPDLVILDHASYMYSGISDQLSAFGIKYIVTGDELTLGNIYNNIQLLGDALGKSASAKKVISEMGASIQTTVDKIRGASSDVTVAFLFLGSSQYYAVGNTTFVHSEIELAGATNAFGNQSGWLAVSLEAIVDANPDIIIIDAEMGSGSTTDYNATYASMQADPLWSQIEAVKNGNVYFLSNSARAVCENASLRIVEGTALFSMMCHPEMYATDLPRVIDGGYQQYLV
ncbi:MAG: Cobalamin-binding protein precursor [Methanomassiliicoccales archaeon PtaU1.Bin030]|nr:MAG: Cobalamin-binding protein precursor [Methanomassiliicoccales archaeon PtaU1.Bin030]